MTDSTICALPFMAVDRHFDRLRPCCMYNSVDWPVFRTIDEYWNSQQLLRLRSSLQNGQQDPGCVSCWRMENLGQISLRQSVNMSRLDSINRVTPKITQVKIITGKTCNLACMMCFSTVSSTHQQLWKDSKIWSIPVNRTQDLEYDHDMDRYIRTHADDLRYIEALGGEPLFSKSFLDLISYLVDTGASQHITLFIITNGTLLTPKMLALLDKFQKTVFTVSVDGVGAVNEYQRWPSDWTIVRDNLEVMSDNFDVAILPTVTAINVCRLHELYDYCHGRNLTINNFGLVGGWPQLSPHNLPAQLHKHVDDRFKKLLEPTEPADPKSLTDFIHKWDQQRGISILDYLPEWQGLI